MKYVKIGSQVGETPVGNTGGALVEMEVTKQLPTVTNEGLYEIDDRKGDSRFLLSYITQPSPEDVNRP